MALCRKAALCAIEESIEKHPGAYFELFKIEIKHFRAALTALGQYSPEQHNT